MNWPKKIRPNPVVEQEAVIATAPAKEVVVASVPVPQIIEGVRMENILSREVDVYVRNVYCCNCDLFHFNAAFPKGKSIEGCTIQCPRCGVTGQVNELGQVWPLDRGMRR